MRLRPAKLSDHVEVATSERNKQRAKEKDSRRGQGDGHDCLARDVVFGRIPVSGADLWPKAAMSFVLFVILCRICRQRRGGQGRALVEWNGENAGFRGS